MGFGERRGHRDDRPRRGRAPRVASSTSLAGLSAGAVAIGCTPPSPPDLLERAVAVAGECRLVVCVVGTDGDWESEGNDRESMALPASQDELVRGSPRSTPGPSSS